MKKKQIWENMVSGVLQTEIGKSKYLKLILPGKKTISASCHKNLKEEVATSFCDKSEKPETGLFSCNEQACPPR